MSSQIEVLFLTPPRVLFDLTTHYRYAELGEVVDYIRKFPSVHVRILDMILSSRPVRHVAKELFNDYDLVVLYGDVSDAKRMREFGILCKQISPSTRVMAFGDATLLLPQYFARYPFDAVHVTGDADVAISDYLGYLSGEAKLSDVGGLIVKVDDKYLETKLGRRNAPEAWGLPALDLLPLSDYRRFAEDREVSAFETSVFVAKGCPFKCAFCRLAQREGTNDRRRPVNILLEYLQNTQRAYEFDVYQLHAGTFTANREWCLELCEAMLMSGLRITWKCTTTVGLVDDELLASMSKAGCRQIGFGVEMLRDDGSSYVHKYDPQHLVQLSQMLKKHKIVGRAFLMLGMLGEKKTDVLYTMNLLRELGFKLRPVGYTPYRELASKTVEELDALDLEKYDRRTYMTSDLSLSPRDFWSILISSNFSQHPFLRVSGGEDKWIPST